MANSLRSKYALSSLILLLVIISDQLSKAFFTSTCNPGVAFSFLESKGRLNILLSFAVLVCVAYFLIRQETKLQIIAASLVLAGGVSNLADRIGFGCVRDFINLNFWPSLTWLSPSLTRWPSFNLADSAICLGVGILIISKCLGRDTSRTVDAS